MRLNEGLRAIGQPGLQLLTRGILVDLNLFPIAADHVGRHGRGPGVALGIDVDQRRAVGSADLGPPALMAARTVGQPGSGEQVLPGVAAAQGPVVNPSRLHRLDVGQLVNRGDREQAGRIGIEIRRLDRPTLAAAGADDSHQRDRIPLMHELMRSAAGEQMHVVGQMHDRRPRVGRIDNAAGPVDRNSAFGQTLELLDQGQGPSGASQLRIEDVAGEDQEVRLLGQHRIEDPLGGPIGRIQKEIPQMVGDLTQPGQRLFEVEVSRVNETERPLRHSSLLAREMQALRRAPGPRFVGAALSWVVYTDSEDNSMAILSKYGNPVKLEKILSNG